MSAIDDAPTGQAWEEIRAKVAHLGERLDAHRKAALARSDKVTMTCMYNIVDKLRAGTPLTKAEQEVSRLADCGTIRTIHDELDRAVAGAYGWPWPMSEAMLLARFGGLSRLPGTVTGQWASDGEVFTDHLISYVVALPSITGGGLVGEVVQAAKTHYAQEAIYLRYLGISEIL